LSDARMQGAGLCADLVRALERARSRFAVAVAMESKRITSERLRQLMETEREMRQWVKELRCFPGDSADPDWNEAIRAARSLLNSSAGGESAQSLSDRMRQVMNQYQRR
jgi:hypothetical protein